MVKKRSPIIDKRLMGIILFLMSMTFFLNLPEYYGDFRIFFVFIILIIILASLKATS